MSFCFNGSSAKNSSYVAATQNSSFTSCFNGSSAKNSSYDGHVEVKKTTKFQRLFSQELIVLLVQAELTVHVFEFQRLFSQELIVRNTFPHGSHSLRFQRLFSQELIVRFCFFRVSYYYFVSTALQPRTHRTCCLRIRLAMTVKFQRLFSQELIVLCYIYAMANWYYVSTALQPRTHRTQETKIKNKEKRFNGSSAKNSSYYTYTYYITRIVMFQRLFSQELIVLDLSDNERFNLSFQRLFSQELIVQYYGIL